MRRRRIIVDIDTQRDFLTAEGQACVRNHRRVLTNIRRVAAWARAHGIHMISTAQIYNGSNGHKAKYCIGGTDGQKKISYTLRGKRFCYEADGNTDLPRDILRTYKQVVLNKRAVDPFVEPRIDRLFTELRADELILIGACAEDAVKATALGLLHRNKKVTLVTDAIGTHNKSAADMAMRQVQAKGARLIDTKTLAGSSCLNLVGVCGCPRCRGLMRKEAAPDNDTPAYATSLK